MDKVILSPIELGELLEAVRGIVKEELQAEQSQKLQATLLSPKEVCQLFNPSISLVTLNSWTKQGRLQERRIGGRVYYMYSEVMAAVKVISRYKRGNGNDQ